MTATITEDITHLDPGPPLCEMHEDPADAGIATHAMHTRCGCITLLCDGCTRVMFGWLKRHERGDGLLCMRCDKSSGPLQHWSEWLSVSPL